MGRFLRLPVIAILVLALVAALGGDARAASVITGTIKGKTFDEKGEPLVGVTISLRSPELVREQVRLTDAEGDFFADGLTPGKYVVTAQLSGYITISFDTEVVVDRTTTLPITMKEGEMTETVTVTASRPVVDKTVTEKAEVYDKTFTDNLPAGRSYQALLQFAPGVVGGSNPNILGGTSSSNNYLIDGVSIRDPVTGTFGSNINYDSVDFVEVKLVGVSAEYGEFQGGVSNVVSKSGGNDFTGSFRAVTSNPAWQLEFGSSSQNEFAAPVGTGDGLGFTYTRPTIPSRPESEKTNRISATLGGPVLPDRIWFFLGYDNIQNLDVGFLGNPVGGVNGNGLYGDFFDGELPTVKLTWQTTNNHRLQYSYFEDPADTTRCYNQIFFGGACSESYTVDLQGQGGYSWSGNWGATWSPTVTSDFKFTKFKNAFKISPLTPIPVYKSLIQVSPGGLGSGAGMAPAIERNLGGEFDANVFDETPEDRKREQYEAQAVWFLDTKGTGSHTIKIGADYKEQERVGASIIQGNALLYFDAMNVDLNLPETYNPDENDPNSIYNINNRAYYSFFDFAPPTQAGPINKFTALYVNDEWQLNDRFSFNLGLRYEKSDNRNDLNEKIISDSGFAPRLGAAWDITGQGKHVLKATASRYLAGINLTTLAPFVRLAGGQSAYDIYFNTTGTTGVPVWELAAQVRPDPDTNQWEDGIEPQYIDEYSIGYEVQVVPTFGLGARYVYRTWDNIITTNFAYDYSGPAPRQLQTLGVEDNAERTYNAVMLTADKRFADNWELRANYVYSETEGNVETENGFDRLLAFPGVPQLITNRQGLLSFDTKHAFKIQGYYDIPLHSARHAVNLGAIFDYRSGNPYTRSRQKNIVVGPGEDGIQDFPLGTNQASAAASDDQISINELEFFDPRGSSGREPSNWQLDLLAAYKLKFTKNFNFELRFEVTNVTNEQKPDVDQAVSTNFWTQEELNDPVITTTPAQRAARERTNYLFGFPTAYTQFQAPRSYLVNAAITW